MKENRSGILCAGVIGGKNQDGPWKLNARFNKKELIQRIEKIAMYESRVRLYNLDAKALIQEVIPELPENSLIYLDPPYYVKGQALYENHYEHNDHEEISKLVQNDIKRPWVVSYDHAPEIVKMYKNCPSITYGINYSAQERYKGAEVMFFSKKLNIPNIENPVKIKVA